MPERSARSIAGALGEVDLAQRGVILQGVK